MVPPLELVVHRGGCVLCGCLGAYLLVRVSGGEAMKRELRKLVKQAHLWIGGDRPTTKHQLDAMRSRLPKGLPEGACDWCGKHKINVYGLCPHCFRFPKGEVK